MPPLRRRRLLEDEIVAPLRSRAAWDERLPDGTSTVMPDLPRRPRLIGPSDDELVMERPAPAVVAPLPPATTRPRPDYALPPVGEVDVIAPHIDSVPPPVTYTDSHHRPRLIPGLEASADALRQQRGELEAYQPQKADWKDYVANGLKGLLLGGPGGAIGAVGMTAVDPRGGDRMWRARQLGHVDEQLGQIRQRGRETMQDDLLRAQVDETKAQAEQRRRPARPTYGRETLEDGTVVQTQLNPETGVHEPVVREGRPIVLSQPRPKVRVSTPQGELEVNPEAALGYFGALSKEERDVALREGKRASVQAAVAENEAAERDALAGRSEASRLLATLRAQLAALPANTPNYWSQHDALEGQVRDAEAEVGRRQTVAERAAADARTARAELQGLTPRTSQSTPPAPQGVTEASVRAEARRRKEPEDAAVQRARDLKWIP